MTSASARVRSVVGFAGRALARHPLAVAFLVVYLTVGAISSALWSPLRESPIFESVAYGLPALAAGRWWTPVTGAFFSEVPWHYPLVGALMVLAVGFLERRRSRRWVLGAFWVGQVGGVLATAAILDMLGPTGWPWALRLGETLDVGPSCGLLVVAALGIASMRAPWRFRGRLVLGGLLLVMLILEGTLADLEHAVSAGAVLVFGFGRSPRATAHEWRLVVFGAVAAIGAMQLVAALVPTQGPLGSTVPRPVSWLDIAIDVGLILVIGWSLVHGRRWAWWVAVVLAAFNVLELVAALTFLDGDVSGFDGAGVAAAASVLWAIAFVLLILGRRAFAVSVWRRGRFVSVDAGESRERLVGALRRFGGGTLGWMSTWPRMRVRFGEGDAWALPVRRVGTVAIVLGDPIGPRDTWEAAIRDFRLACEREGLTPCFFSSSPETAAAAIAEDAQWRSISVGEDVIVDLPGLEFTGKQWQPVRGAANRAEREGIAFRLTRLRDEPRGIVQQVREISESWVGDKTLPEMGFTLGGIDEALDPAVRVALAVDAAGTVHGVLSWLPIFGAETAGGENVVGWVLDVMRRRDDGFGPAMEFLIGQSFLAFRDEGARFASLSGAPLTRSDEDAQDDGAIGALLTTVASMLEPAYGFRSLHRFKEKFNPRYVSMRLLYRDEAALPRIAGAIVKAYLPEASVGDLARAGLSLTRR